MRRKGERKRERQWMPWGPIHPVQRSIRSGDGWFSAWFRQACTPYPVIERKAGIAPDRIRALDAGAPPTPQECAALAALWNCPLADITASIALHRELHPSG